MRETGEHVYGCDLRCTEHVVQEEHQNGRLLGLSVQVVGGWQHQCWAGNSGKHGHAWIGPALVDRHFMEQLNERPASCVCEAEKGIHLYWEKITQLLSSELMEILLVAFQWALDSASMLEWRRVMVKAIIS
jgi:hypothetical protein